jgi:hypothetical protein
LFCSRWFCSLVLTVQLPSLLLLLLLMQEFLALLSCSGSQHQFPMYTSLLRHASSRKLAAQVRAEHPSLLHDSCMTHADERLLSHKMATAAGQVSV